MKQIQKWTITMLDDALATASHNPPAGPPPDFPVIITQLTDVIVQARQPPSIKLPTEDRRQARFMRRAQRCSAST